MPVVFEAVPAVSAADPELRRQLLDTWVRVTDAGGSVGFVPPADPAQVAVVLDGALRRVAEGLDALGVLRAPDGSAVGMGLLVDNGSALGRHWRTVLRVMVHPDHQGRGAGSLLMSGLHAMAAGLGLDHVQLTVRDGQDLEAFYHRLGYRTVGRHPRAVRVAPDDLRDEVMLVADVAPP